MASADSPQPAPSTHWPARLWVVRHGQSAGNVARDVADAGGHAEIELGMRDADVPLSALGEDQARALGHWFAAKPPEDRPNAVLASPFLRARQTARLICEAGGLADPALRFCIDERLREREFGILDRLTTAGIAARFPDQAEARGLLGKFYHRPPGGESWCDVILRLRSTLDTLSLHHRGQRVLIVGHQVVVLCMRYLLEGLDEAAIMEIDRNGDVVNCGVTEYVLDPEQGLELAVYNFAAPLREEGAAVTASPDAPVAAR